MEDSDRALLRRLLRRPVLALAVIIDGEPCAGVVPFLADRDGAGLLVHVSSLARHTAGLADGARFSAVVQAEVFEDPLRVPRVMLEGVARTLTGPEREQAAARWVEAFPQAAQTLTLSDFRFVHLEIDRGRLVADFGRAMGLAPRVLREIFGSTP